MSEVLIRGLGGIRRRVVAWYNDLTHEARMQARGRGLNNAAIAGFKASPPRLEPTNGAVLGELQRSGVVVGQHMDVGISEETFRALSGQASQLAASALVREDGRQRDASVPGGVGVSEWEKRYLTRLLGERPQVGLEDPIIQAALSPGLLDTVNHYFGAWTILHYVDVWLTQPTASETRRSASQRWHRDPEDARIIKAFLYLADINPENGPLEYVRCSRRGEESAYGRKWRRPSQSYPPDAEFERVVRPEDRLSCPGPAGTLVLVDTTGLHRGGYLREGRRLFATWTYRTRASLLETRFDLRAPTLPVSGPLAYALGLYEST
jgi:hypothetical protein